MKIPNVLKRLFYRSEFVEMYPLSNVPNACDIINNVSEDDTVVLARISDILDIINLEMRTVIGENDDIQREIDLCNKNKTVKVKTVDEQGNKIKYKKKDIVTKKGYQRDKAKFSEKYEQNQEYLDKLNLLFYKIKKGILNNDDIAFIDEILYKNRHNVTLEVILLAIVILCITLFIIFR